jgi:hypothetical protein
MLKPLREEQVDMRARWSDPAYRWANDSELRRSKQGRPRATEHEETAERQPTLPSSLPHSGGKAATGARPESEGDR